MPTNVWSRAVVLLRDGQKGRASFRLPRGRAGPGEVAAADTPALAARLPGTRSTIPAESKYRTQKKVQSYLVPIKLLGTQGFDKPLTHGIPSSQAPLRVQSSSSDNSHVLIVPHSISHEKRRMS